MNTINILTTADSYKYSHFNQYPDDMVAMFDYAEARSGKVYPETKFFGMRYFIKEYLNRPFTAEDVDEAAALAKEHGIPFNEEGFRYILKKHGGRFPVRIRAVEEGSVIPTGNVLFTIESTDENVPWVVGFLETLMMKIWYMSNVATRSHFVKEKVLRPWWEKTVDEEAMAGIAFAYHNFGDRGSTTEEAAIAGGIAHLSVFSGTDNFVALKKAKNLYGFEGFSIPAMEHSTVTIRGREGEFEQISRFIENYKNFPIVAAVCDSYDYLNAVRTVTGGDFKKRIESEEYPKLIIRPDSGDYRELIERTLDIMEENRVAFDVNQKGYRVFRKYGIIWGDGIDDEAMNGMLEILERRGYAASNIAFGSGGWLMQKHNRDTQGWAIKCSWAKFRDADGNESEIDVYKNPSTDTMKKSKAGRLTLIRKGDKFKTVRIEERKNFPEWEEAMATVYEA